MEMPKHIFGPFSEKS